MSAYSPNVLGNGLQLDKLLPSSREILKHELMPVPIANELRKQIPLSENVSSINTD
jgi:hypothetical protein